MGVSITYNTTGPVSPDIRASVMAEADERNREHLWWCENLVFVTDPERPTHLVGDTKLFLPGYSLPGGGCVDVDPDDDSLMAYRDARYILGLLASWARAYDLEWEVSVEAPVGLVGSTGPDESLEEFMEALASEISPAFRSAQALEERAVAIAAKYASRSDY